MDDSKIEWTSTGSLVPQSQVSKLYALSWDDLVSAKAPCTYDGSGSCRRSLVHSSNCALLERHLHKGFASTAAYDEARRAKGNALNIRKAAEALKDTLAAAGATALPSGGREGGGEIIFSKDEAKLLFELKDKDLADVGAKVGARWQYKFDDLVGKAVAQATAKKHSWMPPASADEISAARESLMLKMGSRHAGVQALNIALLLEAFNAAKAGVDEADVDKVLEDIERTCEQERQDLAALLAKAEAKKRAVEIIRGAGGGEGGMHPTKKLRAEE